MISTLLISVANWFVSFVAFYLTSVAGHIAVYLNFSIVNNLLFIAELYKQKHKRDCNKLFILEHNIFNTV